MNIHLGEIKKVEKSNVTSSPSSFLPSGDVIGVCN